MMLCKACSTWRARSGPRGTSASHWSAYGGKPVRREHHARAAGQHAIEGVIAGAVVLAQPERADPSKSAQN